MTDVVTSTLQVDLKRRTTLPGDILTAAGIPPGSTLVARVDAPGRIVLESPQLLLTLLQDDIAAAAAAGVPGDLEAGEAPLADQFPVDGDAKTARDHGGQAGTAQVGVGESGASDHLAKGDEGGRA